MKVRIFLLLILSIQSFLSLKLQNNTQISSTPEQSNNSTVPLPKSTNELTAEDEDNIESPENLNNDKSSLESPIKEQKKALRASNLPNQRTQSSSSTTAAITTRTSDVLQLSSSLNFINVDISACPDGAPIDYCARVYEGNNTEFKFTMLTGGCLVLSQSPESVSSRFKNNRWFLVAVVTEESNINPLNTAGATGTRITLKSSTTDITACPTLAAANYLSLFDPDDNTETVYLKQIFNGAAVSNQFAFFNDYSSKLVATGYSKIFRDHCDHNDLSNGCWMQLKSLSSFPDKSDDIVIEHNLLSNLHLKLISGELGFVDSPKLNSEVVLKAKFETNVDDPNTLYVTFNPDDADTLKNNPINRELNKSCENGRWVVENCIGKELFSFRYACDGVNAHLFYSGFSRYLAVTSAANPLKDNVCFKFFSKRKM